MISQVKLLAQACDCEGANETQSSLLSTDSLNHKAYKTVLLFQSTTLLNIFEVLEACLRSCLNTKTDTEYQNKITKVLSDCLKLQKMVLKTSKNQMTFSTFKSEESLIQVEKVNQFCAPIHICELIEHLILTPNADAGLKEKTCELVISMLNSDYSVGNDPNHPKLLMTLLKVVQDGDTPLKIVSRIMLKVS
jgi:hypothetical protein